MFNYRMVAVPIPPAWTSLVKQPKHLFGWPEWIISNTWQEKPKQAKALSRRPLRSNETERLSLTAQLQNENGFNIEDTRLHIEAYKYRPQRNVSATLQILDESEWRVLARVDWAPHAPHSNVHWRKLALPSQVEGSHVHGFDDNAKLGRAAFQPFSNLPVARSLDVEPRHFKHFLSFVQEAFTAQGLSAIGDPPWQPRLL